MLAVIVSANSLIAAPGRRNYSHKPLFVLLAMVPSSGRGFAGSYGQEVEGKLVEKVDRFWLG